MDNHDDCLHTYQSERGWCKFDGEELPLADWEIELVKQQKNATKESKMTVDKATDNDYKRVAEFLMYHMDQDIRGKLMNELPGAYNRILGYEVVKVVRTSDNTRIGRDK
jgi:hypothetical protein